MSDKGAAGSGGLLFHKVSRHGQIPGKMQVRRPVVAVWYCPISLLRFGVVQVCSGWHCDMEEVLAPVRNARPSNGGSGCDVDLILELRTLHFELQ